MLSLAFVISNCMLVTVQRLKSDLFLIEANEVTMARYRRLEYLILIVVTDRYKC